MRLKSVVPMRTAKIGYIVMSFLLCALGILLIAFPKISASVLGVCIGILMIVFGIVKLVGYFSKDLYRLAFQFDLAFGILIMALGIIVLVKPDNVLNFICIAIGISILADGLFKIQTSLDARKFGIKPWWLVFVIAVLTGALGIALIVRPAESSSILVILLGVSLLVEGILNLSTVLTAVKIVKNQMTDDSDFFEE